jgi:hypothetical protein
VDHGLLQSLNLTLGNRPSYPGGSMGLGRPVGFTNGIPRGLLLVIAGASKSC